MTRVICPYVYIYTYGHLCVCVQLSEIYEVLKSGKQAHQSRFARHFVAYRLCYALMLAEIGQMELSLQYCDLAQAGMVSVEAQYAASNPNSSNHPNGSVGSENGQSSGVSAVFHAVLGRNIEELKARYVTR